MKRCTASMSSLTYAIKGQRALSQEGISCEIVKLDPSLTKKGCAYGIEFPCSEHRKTRAVLTKENIPVTTYLNGSEGTLL